MIAVAAVVSAIAGVPVLYDGGEETAVLALVAARTGLPLEALTAWPLNRLLDGPPMVLGDAVLRRCTSQPHRTEGSGTQNNTVKAEWVRATAAWSARADAFATDDHLDLAVATLGCLNELVDVGVASEVFALRGAAAASSGNVDASRYELRTALNFRPDLLWSSLNPVSGAQDLEVVRAEAGRVALAVTPDGVPSGPWLDGIVLTDGMSVRPGLHLFQTSTGSGFETSWVTVGGDVEFVIPASFPPGILGTLHTDATRAQMLSLLRARFPDFSAAYVSHQGGLWLLVSEAGSLTMTELTAIPQIETPVRKPKTGAKKI